MAKTMILVHLANAKAQIQLESSRKLFFPQDSKSQATGKLPTILSLVRKMIFEVKMASPYHPFFLFSIG